MILALVLLALFVMPVPLWARGTTTHTGCVIGIIDGDTLTVLIDKKPVRVRLWGIDAPEKAQPYGTQARQALSRLASRRCVTLTVYGTDLYRRLLAQVKGDEGRDIGEQQVAAGMAWWYKQYALRAEKLEQLEWDARLSRRGLWADPHPVKPWEWRRLHRTHQIAHKKGGRDDLSRIATP